MRGWVRRTDAAASKSGWKLKQDYIDDRTLSRTHVCIKWTLLKDTLTKGPQKHFIKFQLHTLRVYSSQLFHVLFSLLDFHHLNHYIRTTLYLGSEGFTSITQWSHDGNMTYPTPTMGVAGTETRSFSFNVDTTVPSMSACEGVSLCVLGFIQSFAE